MRSGKGDKAWGGKSVCIYADVARNKRGAGYCRTVSPANNNRGKGKGEKKVRQEISSKNSVKLRRKFQKEGRVDPSKA